jgi:putative oxidoreductase
MEGLEKLKPLALLLLRVGLGIIFVYHGYPKLFTHTRETMQGMAHMGFPAYFAYVAGVFEFFGGLLLIAGLFTRIAGLLLAAEMAVALVKVHGLFSTPLAVEKYEFPLALAVGAFACAALGAGMISLDEAIFAGKRGGSGGGGVRKAGKGKNRE